VTEQLPIPLPDEADWQVPTHEVAVFAPRRHAHALVIPVINEGERIRGQILRIKEANLPVDVIIADGGSSDGSLDPDFVEPSGVRAVLTKTGPGKLSAQLRMAYAWCLRQGYDGIVTIDGNGKDGVEAIAQFVAKLEAGCDYVQGSRYLPGGEAENTPLERTIANRLVHAPLLSLAGRHWFTDTTNGFRAYSRAYLTHPQVRPFREEFEVYNLLFYLTVRAGQLGLKVDHVPVARRYPDNGKVPTKIGGLSSKLALLGETVRAATGAYTPDDAVRKMPSLVWPALAVLMVLLPLFASVMVEPAYLPDSWALYELSGTVFDDFYRFSHFRSYGSDAPYSSAFPPLWPVLVAVVDAVLGTGARTGLYLALASFAGFALVSEVIGRRAFGAPWIGTATALVLLLGPKMVWYEIEGGRTIPLQLLLYALVLLGLVARGPITMLRAAAIGFVAGLAVLNRFDAVLLPVFAALFIAVLARSPGRVAVAVAGALVAVSPWIAYSLATFGSLFATDNSGVALLLDPDAFVTDWWPQPRPTISDDPAAWALKLAGHTGGLVHNGLALLASPLGLAFALGMIPVCALRFLASRAPASAKDARAAPRELWIATAFAAAMGAAMLPQVLTGYLDYRYYAAAFWSLYLALAGWLVAYRSSAQQRRSLAAIAAVPMGAAVLLFAVLQLVGAAQEGRLDLSRWAGFDDPREVQLLTECLGDDRSARILVIGDDILVAKAGAQGGFATMMEPRNLAEGRLGPDGWARFVESWRVGYILLAAPDRGRDVLRHAGPGIPVDCPLPLFRLPRG
jgi:hypothetical protein